MKLGDDEDWRRALRDVQAMERAVSERLWGDVHFSIAVAIVAWIVIVAACLWLSGLPRPW